MCQDVQASMGEKMQKRAIPTMGFFVPWAPWLMSGGSSQCLQITKLADLTGSERMTRVRWLKQDPDEGPRCQFVDTHVM